MSTQAAKRRRRDVANFTLSKPFRSPFKRPPTTTNMPTLELNPICKIENTESSYCSEALETIPNRKHSYSSFQLGPRSSHNCLSKRKQFSPRTTAILNEDPDVSPLLRIQHNLEKQLRELNEQLDIAEQAKKIEEESSKKGFKDVDGELSELITKWTIASRQAAEELFSKVQDRVNRMGGPRAWKEMEKRRLENFRRWDQEDAPKINHDNNEDMDNSHEMRDIYAEYSIDPETDIERSQRLNGIEEIPGEEDDFTMAMMLKTMNIDLKVIGYDRYQQQWID
ncbi:Swi5-dependent recombination DNA repair protein 1 [Erysiphe neolycopersici]|uniref:Swi5-dependent recombination DNA repair protein 1 n=1 Tax=Erysiphe neolycopersici TaxID=212602 RepID=A0A420I2D0_9PEZI|nr:Swi5-dependent recombination DNA repair protein 1 [Erysiphe neolycopersici]